MGSKLPAEFLYVGLTGLAVIVLGKLYLLYKFCWKRMKNKISHHHDTSNPYSNDETVVETIENETSTTPARDEDTNSINEVSRRRGSKIGNLFNLHKVEDYISHGMEESDEPPENTPDELCDSKKNSAEFLSNSYIDSQIHPPHAPTHDDAISSNENREFRL